jgi:hypothetical protein
MFFVLPQLCRNPVFALCAPQHAPGAGRLLAISETEYLTPRVTGSLAFGDCVMERAEAGAT